MEEQPVKIIKYRGYSVPIFTDNVGQQFWCVLDGEEIGFGAFNINYEADLKYLIDDHLDTLIRFDEPYSKAKLKLFQNGDYQDVGLIYDRRMIKLWLIADKEKFSVDKLKTESLEILKKWTGR